MRETNLAQSTHNQVACRRPRCKLGGYMAMSEKSADKDVPAIRGENTASVFGGFGVFGKSDLGFGVHGENGGGNSGPARGAGVWGESQNGFGVFGSSDNHRGVVGVSVSHDGVGVHGIGTHGYGVLATSQNGVGLGAEGAVLAAFFEEVSRSLVTFA